MTRRRADDLPDSSRRSPLAGGEDHGRESDGECERDDIGSSASEPAEERGIELAPDQLSPEALQGLVEEFVSREGTDYGHADRSLESKVAAVHRQLESGEARIVFDLESETASIVASRDLERRGGRPRR